MTRNTKTLKAIARQHLVTRWRKVIVPNGWAGRFTERFYVARNLASSVQNLRNGVTFDGEGGYVQPTDPPPTQARERRRDGVGSNPALPITTARKVTL